jgi:hypothetical protein
MSNTPRTDKEAFDITTGEPDIDGVVMADFARKLELELNEQVLLNGKGSEREYSLLGKIERLERENDKLREALKEISTTAHCIALAGPLNTPTLQDAWAKFMKIDSMAIKALSKKP